MMNAIDIQDYAERLLALNPDPIPRFVIYRDLLGYTEDNAEYQTARDAVWAHPFVAKIADAQNDRGFWEPFHGTTEGMIRRLLSFGLDCTHPTLAAAQSYLVRLLNGEEQTGQYEKQDHARWYPEMLEPLIAASMLSLIVPDHPLVEQHRTLWASFADTIFSDGTYSEEHDRAVKAAHFGYEVQRPIPPCNYYCLLLTAPVGTRTFLAEKTDRALIDLCMAIPGMGYVYNESPGVCIPIDTHRRDSRDFWHWIRALSILAPYRGYDAYEEPICAHLLSQRGEDGLWEFPQKFDFSVSDRYAGKRRRIDSTLYVLRVLMRMRGY